MHMMLMAILYAQTPTFSEMPKWEVFSGFSAGIRPETKGVGAVGLLGVTRQLLAWLRLEGSVGMGLYTSPLDHLVPFRVGARVEWPSSWVRPFLSVAFAHQHETPWAHFVQSPVGVTLTQSEHLHHRTGVDTGIGVVFDFPGRRAGGLAGRLTTRVSIAHFLGAGPPRYVDFTTTVGLCF
jgi:hypothetical protein